MIKTILRILLILFIFIIGLWGYVYFTNMEEINEEEFEVNNNIDSSLFLKKEKKEIKKEIPIITKKEKKTIKKKIIKKKTIKKKKKKKRIKNKKKIENDYVITYTNPINELKDIINKNKQAEQFKFIEDKEEDIIKKLDRKIYEE